MKGMGEGGDDCPFEFNFDAPIAGLPLQGAGDFRLRG